VKRLGLLTVAVAAALAAGTHAAQATNECRGLQICVRVAGPWVVVPAGLRVPRVRADYQLSCPRSYVVGGLDAELTDRAIDLDFLGKLGSPVGPGVTTSRAAMFGATYVGASARTPSFRPHVGCIPLTGGGTGPVPYRVSPRFPPGEPTIRRVRTVRLRPGQVLALAACAAGERLISAWHAIGFYTASPPSAALIQSVVATRHVRGNRVQVRVRAGAAAGQVRAIVQVGAVCGGGA
jgi:hypothetical protein